MRHLFLFAAFLVACAPRPSVAPALVEPVHSVELDTEPAVALPAAPAVTVATILPPLILTETRAVLGVEVDEALMDPAVLMAEKWGCDPIETIDPAVRKPRYTKAEKRANLSRVRAACRAQGASTEACDVMVMIAARESSGKSSGRHRLPGDAAHALSRYISQAPRYGWYVVWPLKERMVCEGRGEERVCRPNWDSVEVRPLQSASDRNPHYGDPRRWATGLGNFGTNPALHLASKLDPMAPPEALCKPENSTRVALRTFQRAVNAYGADEWVEVAAVFGGRVANNRPKRNAKMDAKFCARAADWGIDCHANPRGKLGRKIPQPPQLIDNDFVIDRDAPVEEELP